MSFGVSLQRPELGWGSAKIGLPQHKDSAKGEVEKARALLLDSQVQVPNRPSTARRVPPELGDPALDFELAKTYLALGYLDRQLAAQAAADRGIDNEAEPSVGAGYKAAKDILDRLVPVARRDDPLRLRYEHQRAVASMNLGNVYADFGRTKDAAPLCVAAADFWRERLTRTREPRDVPLADEIYHFDYRRYLALVPEKPG